METVENVGSLWPKIGPVNISWQSAVRHLGNWLPTGPQTPYAWPISQNWRPIIGDART
jgi:hypothetical protein